MGKYALLIGVGEYGKGLQPLPAAPNDVAALKKVLEAPNIAGFDEVKDIVNPTHAEMAREIELWFQGREPEDLVLLFFSGHGVKDDSRELYFASRNTEKVRNSLLISTATSARFVSERIRRCKAKQLILILDCCFSGAFGDLVGRDGGEVDVQDQLGAEGRVVLTSTSAVDYSFEEKETDCSIYTRYLVEGIATGAADEDGDGFITVDELHRYAGRKVEEASPAMSPKIFIPQGEGYRICLARSPQDDPKLRYRKEAEKRADASEFSIPAKMLLMDLRREFGVSDGDAETIEAEVLSPYREYEQKRNQYQNALKQCLQQEKPLKLRTIRDLRDLCNHLQLKPQDVVAVEQAELQGYDLASYAAKIQQKWQAALELQQQQEKLDRQRQTETDAKSKQHEREAAEKRQRKAEARRRQQADVEWNRLQPTLRDGKTTLSRQQFLKWGGLSSIGLISTFGISQVFKDSPSQTSDSEDNAPNTPDSINNPPPQVDYSRLEELLKAGQWEEADQETLNVMLKIANRGTEVWLDLESLQNFPCNSLEKIDQLWVDNSESKFGFSVQKKIYINDCKAPPSAEPHETAWNCFVEKVGWQVDGKILSYSDLVFDTNAPVGHLPVLPIYRSASHNPRSSSGRIASWASWMDRARIFTSLIMQSLIQCS